MKHKICYCAGRPECHYCGFPCYAEDKQAIAEWILKMEQEDCE